MQGKTGAPECPAYVEKARDIREMIKRKCELIVHVDDLPSVADDNEEQNDMPVKNATNVNEDFTADISNMNRKKQNLNWLFIRSGNR